MRRRIPTVHPPLPFQNSLVLFVSGISVIKVVVPAQHCRHHYQRPRIIQTLSQLGRRNNKQMKDGKQESHRIVQRGRKLVSTYVSFLPLFKLQQPKRPLTGTPIHPSPTLSPQPAPPPPNLTAVLGNHFPAKKNTKYSSHANVRRLKGRYKGGGEIPAVRIIGGKVR